MTESPASQQPTATSFVLPTSSAVVAPVIQDLAGSGAGRRSPVKLIKVLHLINGEHFSGAERVQDLLGKAMPEFGYQVSFACLKPNKFPAVRTSTNCPLFETPMRHKLDLGCVKRIRHLFHQHKFELIHAHTPRTLMIGALAARKLKCPLVYHVHSPVGLDSARGLSNRLNTWIETWSLSKVDRMICVSGSLAQYMESLGHPADRLRVVCNGVEAIPDLPSRPVPQEPWTLGTMALFRPRKGTEILLEALSILKQRGVELQLRAVGPFETESYHQEILARVAALGIGDQIQWTGFQRDVDQQLRQMDLFVLPSLYGEGLPMVVLEAMANGVPVVASRVEGVPEAVRDGIDGLIFEPGSAQDLANKLTTLLGDGKRWQALSQSSLHRQRSELSDISMTRGVAKVYDELLSS